MQAPPKDRSRLNHIARLVWGEPKLLRAGLVLSSVFNLGVHEGSLTQNGVI